MRTGLILIVGLAFLLSASAAAAMGEAGMRRSSRTSSRWRTWTGADRSTRTNTRRPAWRSTASRSPIAMPMKMARRACGNTSISTGGIIRRRAARLPESAQRRGGQRGRRRSGSGGYLPRSAPENRRARSIGRGTSMSAETGTPLFAGRFRAPLRSTQSPADEASVAARTAHFGRIMAPVWRRFGALHKAAYLASGGRSEAPR